MVNDKTLGKHCSFLNKYVPIRIKYLSHGPAIISCGDSSCSNADCNLCNSFVGDKSKGQDYLG